MPALEEFGTLGVTIMLPYCTFTAKVSTHDLDEVIQEIETALDDRDIGPDKEDRIRESLENAYAVALAMVEGKLDNEIAISEIALAFVYAEVMRTSLDEVSDLYGIVGYVLDDNVYLKTFKESKDFDDLTKHVFDIAAKFATVDGVAPDEITSDDLRKDRVLH